MLSVIYFLVSLIFVIYNFIKKSWVKSIWAIPEIILCVALVYTIICAIHLVFFILVSFTIDDSKPPKKITGIYRQVGFDTVKVFLDTMKVRVHSKNLDFVAENVPDKKFMLVSNHLSMYDPLVYLLLYKKYKLAFVSKKENLKIPFVGKYMNAVGCIGLDRDDNTAAVKSINKAADYIKSGKANMGIYPEGYVNTTGEPLMKFRNGAFKIAKKAGVPIIISTIKGTDMIKHRFLRKTSHVYVEVIGMITEEEVKQLNTNQLGEKVYQIMYDNLVGKSNN